ncbi:hypothetical protein [Nonomuraea sp. NPDC003804]|uniref:hypothetical protein n=1 Tax=Nonomuraea sp. NPDC003804 TaxID=3154547 RepID=UPI0033BAED95
MEARKIAQLESETGSFPLARSSALAWLDEPGVVSLTERRLAALPPDTRPLPSVAIYDQLLRRPAAGSPPHSGAEGRP